MSDMDTRLRAELEGLVPLPSVADRSWEDVLRRAASWSPASPSAHWTRGRRVAVMALAAATLLALAASPVGEAIARGFGDFSAWLTGNPGEPAGADQQRAFDEANRRSWAAFPDSPKLRRLLGTEAAGGTFKLFGFRSGSSLCLRLVVTGIPAAQPTTSCAPLAELRGAQQPALVVFADYGYGTQDVPPTEDGLIPTLASVTAGIVADGIDTVEIETTDGTQLALVGSNAFLAVTAEPPLGYRATGAVATGEEGRRWTIPLARAPFDIQPPTATAGVAPGPTRVERLVGRGRIGWLDRREQRGEAIPPDLGERLFHLADRKRPMFVRVIRPDPEGRLRVAIGLVEFSQDKTVNPYTQPGQYLCYYLLSGTGGGGGGCDHFGRQFERTPFSLGISSANGGDQYVQINGLASDDVARLTLYLADGEHVVVPLTDNAYAIDVSRTRFPIRLVGYDDNDTVIGIETFAADPLSDAGPRPIEGKQRVAKRVAGPTGATATLRTGPATDGGRCWRITFGNGAGGRGCNPKRDKTPLLAVGTQLSGGDTFITGSVGPTVTTVTITLDNGRRLTIQPADGFLLDAIPRRLIDTRTVVAVGYDERGHAVSRQQLASGK